MPLSELLTSTSALKSWLRSWRMEGFTDRRTDYSLRFYLEEITQLEDGRELKESRGSVARHMSQVKDDPDVLAWQALTEKIAAKWFAEDQAKPVE